jgi:hypothetical protein
MSAERLPALDPRVQQALDELMQKSTERYPQARFQVARGVEDPEEIWLQAVVDVQDEEVLDLVIDCLIELHTDEGLPVHVLPLPLSEYAEARSGEGTSLRAGARGRDAGGKES